VTAPNADAGFGVDGGRPVGAAGGAKSDAAAPPSDAGTPSFGGANVADASSSTGGSAWTEDGGSEEVDASMGGASGSAGADSAPIGGMSAVGGMGPVDAGPEGTFRIESSLASEVDPGAPTTVGIVTFSIVATSVLSASVDFGLDTTYGTRVRVDLAAPEYRTVLLGMKPSQNYHFRVEVETPNGTYLSEDRVLATGPAAPAVVSRFEVLDAAQHQRGFLMGSYWRAQATSTIFILDADGELVWSMKAPIPGVARATFSADGKSLWIVSTNNSGLPLWRMTPDGLTVESYSDAIGSHDITAVEGDLMAFIEYGEDDCDSVFEIDLSGNLVEVFELSDYLSEGVLLACHGNALRYVAEIDSYVLSSLLEDVFVIPRDGSAVTRLSTIVPGGNASWGGTQHGVHLLGDSLLIFANDEGNPEGGFQSGGPSTAIEYSLIDGSELWRYESALYTANLGDVQRLAGGNTLITYSNEQIIREVTPTGSIVFEAQSSGPPFGYPALLDSLYVDPPSFDERPTWTLVHTVEP
jgi:hypothetical protein